MFSTIYSDFTGIAAEVYIETEFRLQPLLKRSFPDFRVFSRRNPPDKELTTKTFDYQIAAGDIGRYRRRAVSDFPVSRPSLKSDQKRTEYLRGRYLALANGRRLVGVSWQSNSEQAGVPRSVPLEALRPLLQSSKALFVNLQYGDVKNLKFYHRDDQ